MFYSITFGNKNTWDDWRLIPTSPPMITPPTPYTNYVEIPGRVLGPIDLSETLSGAPSYTNSEGEWEFVAHPDFQGGYSARPELFEEIRHHLHNKTLRIAFDEDQQHYFMGRFEVGIPKTSNNGTTYTIKYKIPPVRYNTSDDTRDTLYP